MYSFQEPCLFRGLTKFEHASSDMTCASDCSSRTRKTNLSRDLLCLIHYINYGISAANESLLGMCLIKLLTFNVTDPMNHLFYNKKNKKVDLTQ